MGQSGFFFGKTRELSENRQNSSKWRYISFLSTSILLQKTIFFFMICGQQAHFYDLRQKIFRKQTLNFMNVSVPVVHQ